MGIKDMFKDVKELVGINSIDDEIDEIDEYDGEAEEEAVEEVKKAPKKSFFLKRLRKNFQKKRILKKMIAIAQYL